MRSHSKVNTQNIYIRLSNLTAKGKSRKIAPMPIKTYTIRLKNVRSLSPRVKHFEFECDDPALTRFIPGQFITLYIPHQDKTLRRSYSIASLEPNNTIEFAASYVEGGIASNILFNLEPGQCLQAAGPFGRLILKDEDKARTILVGTSTGITPYLAMLNQLREKTEKDPSHQVVIIQGVPTREDVLYEDLFLEASEQSATIHYYQALSREPAIKPKSHEVLGRVQVKLNELNINAATDVVYLCGNPSMVDETFAQLKTVGFDIKDIRREKYISS